jgi:hypothetical protein
MGGLEGRLADYLLKNGVIVPPCKVGQTVFRIITMGTGVKKKSVTHELNGFSVVKYKETQKRFIRDIEVTKNNFIDVCESYGKTVFLTREEAEKALAERSENGKS